VALRVTRIALADNSLYVVEGSEGAILVDAGPDYAGAWEVLAREVCGVRAVAVSHGHADHAGLGARWAAQGVPVFLHPLDHHLVGTLVPRGDGWRVLVEFVETCGAPPEVVASVVDALERRRAFAERWQRAEGYPPAGPRARHPSGLRYDPFVPRPYPLGLPNGLEVRHLPGHTPGTVVIVEPREGWLFSGDQLLKGFTPTPGIQLDPASGGPVRFRSLPRFLDALLTLRDSAFTRCFPGHGEPFADVEDAIDAAIGAIEARTERVFADLRQAGRATPYELAARAYPRALERRFWQVLPAIQGHLDLLEERGLVRREDHTYVPCP
jgi:glyoxylase-like metal-dependent hydrolase (beta-lactamase superfamily II)